MLENTEGEDEPRIVFLRFRQKVKKRCVVRLCLQLFVVGRMSCLRNVCLHSKVQHILCCVFVSFVFAKRCFLNTTFIASAVASLLLDVRY
jgi:hypothetical protein